jgi:hypothetical protein
MRQSRTVRWMDGAAQALIGATTVVAVCMALAGEHPGSPEVRYRAAMESYQAREWPRAYEELSSLADEGDASAARVAAMMARQGPVLFGQRFDVSPERLARWERTMRGDAVALADAGSRRLPLTFRGTDARTAGSPPAVQVARAR